MKAGLKEKIDKFMEYFTTITKDECDWIESILKWDDETKLAFKMAKRMFEEDEENL